MAYYKDNAAHIEEIQLKTSFKDLADDDWGVVRDSWRLLNRFGWHKGDRLYRWLKRITRDRFGRSHITFDELYEETGSELVVVGCNASKGRSVLFSRATTPEFYVERAVRISTSIPLFFRAVFLADTSVDATGNVVGNPGIDKDIDRDRDVFVDGGVLDNYPLHVFDDPKYFDSGEVGVGEKFAVGEVDGRFYNKRTIGFRLGKTPSVEVDHIERDEDEFKASKLSEFVVSIAQLVHFTANTRHLDEVDWHRTVQIDTSGVSGIDFDLSQSDQSVLIERGQDAALAYLDGYGADWLNYVK